MTEINIKLEKLTAEAFAPYGDLIDAHDGNKVIPINYGLTERHHELAKVDVSENDGYPIISLFRTKPVELPFQVRIMERHPLGSQAFITTKGNPYIVIVAEAGEFDYRKLRAFIAMPNQGVNYSKGTWHHYCLGLNSANEFVVVDRGGEGPNCDEVEIPNDVTIIVNH